MRNYALSSQTLQNQRKVLLFHVLDYRCGSQGATEEALENIQDAIARYLSVVNELTQESETRYVEIA